MVSIIMPVYNVEKYVADSLNSLLNQTYDDMEIIIVDDCGTDGSMAIVNKISSDYKGDKKVVVVSDDINKGLSAARNRGISAARGEFIFFIDSDDYLCDNEAIDKLVKRQRETDADVVVANSIMFDDITGKIYKTVDKDYIDGFYANQGETPDLLIGGTVWNKLVNTNFLKEHDLYFDEGIVFEDTAWIFKLMCSSPRIAAMSDKLYRYRCRGGSILNTLKQHHIISRALLPIVCYKWLQRHPTSKKTYSAIAIEDMKLGCAISLINTDNETLIKPVFGIYKKQINPINSDKLTFNQFIKLSLSKLPNQIYLTLIKQYVKTKLEDKPARHSLDLGSNFLGELTDKAYMFIHS